ncbi:Protein of unknown function [Arthrobacter subterraneus]|uniref:DUF3093 domain-containing protein n=2 Tax=Arthrobacter subterraneus TaxID=335973 RepID=A0A1G8NPC2_9MICC|nr:Protein of unknown function [Arthrobacter subterraneus]
MQWCGKLLVMSEAPAPPDAILYDERLWPTPFVWVLVTGVAGASILVFAPISMLTGIIACITIFVIVAALLILSTPRITVTASTLKVGRAHIDRTYLGTARSYRNKEATHQRGPALNALAYLCIRGWIDPVVRIDIDDEEDPTPYWLVSTRHPTKLVNAVSGEALSGESAVPEQRDG